jgi:hypothetical protein
MSLNSVLATSAGAARWWITRTPQRDSVVSNMFYITDVETGIPYWILVLLAVAAFLMTSLAGQPRAPAHEGAGTTLQDQATTSTKTSPSARGRKIPCKTPENASLCYWTHGRLSVWEGTPPFRLWKIGTHRILAVLNGPSHYPPRTVDDLENPEFPTELDRGHEADNRRHKKATGIMWAIPPPVFADFEICPLEPEHKGWMQGVCVESAKNIFIEKDY